MGNLLYIDAVILMISWAMGFFTYSLGGIIHIFLVIAIITIVVKAIQENKYKNKYYLNKQKTRK